jgi:chemotaxis protein MotB
MSEKREEPVIIKKVKKGGHGGHHGGAWKVAYADFVTAMMAFFLVMWIMGLSESTKKDIASYFEDPGAFSFTTGKALPANISSMRPANYRSDVSTKNYDVFTERGGPDAFDSDARFAKLDSGQRAELVKALQDSAVAAKILERKEREVKKFIDSAVQQNPGLKELSESIKVSLDQEGLKIELLETRESLFFEVGSSRMTREAVKLLQMLGTELGKLPNSLRVEGHTDSRPYSSSSSFTNWELSADRANAARRILTQVTGFADRKLLNRENPFDVTNRRISILVEYLKADNFMGAKQ